MLTVKASMVINTPKVVIASIVAVNKFFLIVILMFWANCFYFGLQK